jgi:Protein of unknown function (DUF4238)
VEAKDDHYVARTYLKHFAGPNGLLRAYRKSDGHSFPCRPADVCHEPDGDVIRDFLSEPQYLGEFRGSFEPMWNYAVDAIKRRSPDMRDKFHIAGYWAALMVCTPTWRRVAVEGYNQYTLCHLRARDILLTEKERPDETLSEAIAAIDRGEYVIETEPDYVRAHSAISLLRHTWGLYNARWSVLESDTPIEFITSDNPAAHQDQPQAFGLVRRPPFLRFLPITPSLCLMCDLSLYAKEVHKQEPDFNQLPKGGVGGGPADGATVERINTWVAKCAEDLVLCRTESHSVQNLAARCAKFRVENELTMRRQGRGFVLASQTRVRERG